MYLRAKKKRSARGEKGTLQEKEKMCPSPRAAARHEAGAEARAAVFSVSFLTLDPGSHACSRARRLVSGAVVKVSVAGR